MIKIIHHFKSKFHQIQYQFKVDLLIEFITISLLIKMFQTDHKYF